MHLKSLFGTLLLLAGTAMGLAQTPAQTPTPPNPNDCSLIVPANPLTAQGLATPYQLASLNGTTCHESNPDQSAFVQGAILTPDLKIEIYNPLVIDQGTQPAIKPTVPTIPAGSTVALWFGSNGNRLHVGGKPETPQVGIGHTHFSIRDASGKAFTRNNCVSGVGGSDFGQFAYCNAPAFFQKASAAITAGRITVPALGMGKDGKVCPTTRDFSVVDQDQSDNVTTTYLITATGQVAQDTAANRATLVNANVQANGSDEGLLAKAIDGALGCSPWKAPDLANANALVTALPLNELQAAKFQAAPVALVPENDPMVLVNGQPNLFKQNLYRMGVDQPAAQGNAVKSDQVAYCKNIEAIAPARIALDETYTSAWPSPAAGAANLHDFLVARYNFTISADGLNCAAVLAGK